MRVYHLICGSIAASTTFAWQGYPSHSNNQCAPDVVALATGIHINIVGQVTGEKAEIQALQALETTQATNATAILIGKGKLIADILSGIKIREFNQAVAPSDSAALPGLEQYALAQNTELALARSLSGEAARDAPVLATLLSDVEAGILLNMRNLANATEGCSSGFIFPADTV